MATYTVYDLYDEDLKTPLGKITTDEDGIIVTMDDFGVDLSIETLQLGQYGQPLRHARARFRSLNFIDDAE